MTWVPLRQETRLVFWLYRCVLSAICLVALMHAVPAAGQKKKNFPQPTVERQYVGSAACSRCHLEIANQFAQASMGHSLTPIDAAKLKSIPASADFYDAKSGHHFEVHAENGKLYQTEFGTDSSGKETFRSTHELEWIIGTGENGFGALLRRDDYLFQAPLSYYSKAQKWELSPGYQNGDYGFNRIIQPGCIYCHSGRPQPVAGYAGKYQAKIFTQTSVGCENCHGPGSAHVEAMEQGEEPEHPKRDANHLIEADLEIVNPAKLTGQLSDDICMSCHQSGDARVLQPGKTYQDFRPGEPLDKTVSIFQIPPTREHPPQDDHVEHYYSMSLSKCFRASRNAPGKRGNNSAEMRCITCHDPHVEPSKEEAPAYFNAKCMTCHSTQSCTAPLESRLKTTPVKDNCTGCHMPKRDNRLISHSSATNHRIPARPDEPFPDETFEQTTAAMPDLIHINPAGARKPKDEIPPSALVRLQAYADLTSKKPEYAESWLKTLAELESTTPDNTIVQAASGHRDLQDHKLTDAVSHLQRSLQLDPLQQNVYVDLGEAQNQLGQTEQAIVSAKKAIELDPFVAGLQKTLISRLIDARHYEEAESAMEKYLQLFPEDDFMRKMLAMAKE